MRPRLLALAMLAALLAGSASATTYRALSPQELVLRADLVVIGTVSTTTANEVDGRPWTTVVFTDLNVLRDQAAESAGEGQPDEVELSFLGGSVIGLPDLLVSGLPEFEQGERWLVLAYQDEGLASPIVGAAQGAWLLSGAGATAADGSRLTVDAGGALVRSGAGPVAEAELVEALTALLARGVALEPTPSASEAASEAAGEMASDAASQAEGEAAAEAAGEAEGESASEPATEPSASEPSAPEPGAPDANAEEGGAQGPGAQAAPHAGAARGAAPQATTPGAAAAPRAVAYDVDDEGGPLLLSVSAARAASAWEAAAPGAARFVVAADASFSLRYGTPELMGPDATSLTLVWSDGRVEALVSPLVGELLDAVLLHELGVLLGLPEGGAGVMAFAVAPSIAAPTPADVAALVDLRAYAPEDLDRSGSVDFYDLVIFGQAYGRTGVNLAADFNGDGKVDDADLELLRQAYEFSPPRQQAPK